MIVDLGICPVTVCDDKSAEEVAKWVDEQARKALADESYLSTQAQRAS